MEMFLGAVSSVNKKESSVSCGVLGLVVFVFSLVLRMKSGNYKMKKKTREDESKRKADFGAHPKSLSDLLSLKQQCPDRSFYRTIFGLSFL